MGDTTIAWTRGDDGSPGKTWNPVRGCTKVSAGCKNCYAETFAERWRGVPGHPFEQGFDLRLVPEALDVPLRWKKPRRVFVNSMSDLFHHEVPTDFIEAVFGVMSLAGRHTFQVLTKRPQAMRTFMERTTLARCQAAATWMGVGITTAKRKLDRADSQVINGPWPLPNVWLGTSVEDQRAADERIPELLATPAAVRFLSAEPLLGEVNLHVISHPPANRGFLDALAGESDYPELRGQPHAAPPISKLDWVIVGGESGWGARPCDTAWVRYLVEQCRSTGTACFVKQLGAVPLGLNLMVKRDRAGRDPAEWPEDLRVQQFPEAP
jgi:protein gp37